MVINGIDVDLKASDTMLKMEHSSICRKIKQQKEKRRRMPLLLKRKDEKEKLKKTVKTKITKIGSDICNVYIYISKRDIKKMYKD